ncbi:MAG: glycosyltransferase, partial [Candidatus Bathyarchaeia archaeon]
QKHYYAPALLPMLQALIEADALIVSTPAMYDLLKYYKREIFVIPNYLDDTLWSFRPPSPTCSSPVTIGYMGTDSHKPDLEYVVPVLSSLLKRYSERLRLRFWGVQPPSELLQFPQVEWFPVNYHSYEEFVSFFQSQSADIFIAPLVDNIFNRCKSPIKFFEYTALGAPGVFSRIDPYEGVIRHGRDGFLAYSLNEWEDFLIKLIEDANLRFRMATFAQASVREHWLLSKNAARWREVLCTILAQRRRKTAKFQRFLIIIKSINTQLFEATQALESQVEQQRQTIRALESQVEQQRQTIRALESQVEQQRQTIRALESQVEQQRQTIQALNKEILSYALSRSWRWTRPFRIIYKKWKSWRAKRLCGGN